MSIINAAALLASAGGEYQIQRSVRLRSSASAYFSRTPGSAGTRTTWTWSDWVKRGSISAYRLFSANAGNQATYVAFISDTIQITRVTFGGATQFSVATAAVFRDPSAWYHLVVVMDTTNATSSSRVRLFVNGVQQTLSGTFPALNETPEIGSNTTNYIGAQNSTSFGLGDYFDGYRADVHFIDGQALTPASFGETDTITGVWKPKRYAGTYGTNGFYLNFADNSAATAAAIGKDSSGNGNNWTPNNISLVGPLSVTTITTAKAYAVYAGDGNARTANFSVQYSDDNSTWTTAFSGVMSALTCGLVTGSATGNGSYGAHRFWRYVVGSAVAAHHPRVSRILLGTGSGDTNIVVFTGDNCADSGTIPGAGATYAYDFSTGVNTYDSMLDVPTMWADGGNGRGNYAVLNTVDRSFMTAGSRTISNGNLTVADAATSYGLYAKGTIFVSSGKWYWEVNCTSIGGTTANIGVVLDTANTGAFYQSSGQRNPTAENTGTTAYGASYTTGDVIGVALDMDAGSVTFYKNNASQGAVTGLSGSYSAGLGDGANATQNTYDINFGQRPFAYTPPTGFKALHTGNLPEPSIKLPNKWFDVSTWTGDNTTNRTIANSGGFQPDLVWTKGRSTTWEHFLQDSSRGFTEFLRTNTNVGAGTTSPNIVTASASNGFVIENNGNSNASGSTYVGWQWKKGATPGFDIVTYTGNGAARTINHSLGAVPQMMILKGRSGGSIWGVWHGATTAVGQGLALEQTVAKFSEPTLFTAAPTSTGFTIGTYAGLNSSGLTYVAYLFSEVPGFSKFGSYVGNGSADGPMVYCGLMPRYVMVKNISAAGAWMIFDTARSVSNATDDVLEANTSNAEAVNLTNNLIDVLANGFKLRGTQSNGNASGNTYIFAAFAESPFKYALAR